MTCHRTHKCKQILQDSKITATRGMCKVLSTSHGKWQTQDLHNYPDSPHFNKYHSQRRKYAGWDKTVLPLAENKSFALHLPYLLGKVS